MDEKSRKRTSKFLSLVLRHEPQKIGLRLDPGSWVDVAELLSACHRHGMPLDAAELEEIVATNDKRRFSFSEDGSRIRANQGHSIEVELGHTPQIPPAQLFHGTAARNLDAIRMEGLHKGSRHHVHLSVDIATARKVGQRLGIPVVLTVLATTMYQAGHLFYLTDNGVWLTEHVPAEFIKLPSSHDSTL